MDSATMEPQIKNQNTEAGAAPGAPPPDARVRTMQSDLSTVARGGFLSSSLDVQGIAVELSRKAKSAEQRLEKIDEQSGTNRFSEFVTPRLALIVGIFIVLVIVGAFGYVAFSYIAKNSANNLPPAEPQAEEPPVISPQTSEQPSLLPVSPVPGTTRPVTVRIDFGERYTERLIEAIGIGPDSVSALIGLKFENSMGHELSAQEMLSLTAAQIFSTQFAELTFVQNYEAFVYRDDAGLWPAYILSPRPGTSVASAQIEVKRLLENSSHLANIFVVSPGVPAATFKDKRISATSIRSLAFSAPKAEFDYTWVKDNLVLATSETALRTMLERLGR